MHRQETAVELVAAAVGGYLGTVVAGRVPSMMLRRFVIGFGVIMMAVFLGRACP